MLTRRAFGFHSPDALIALAMLSLSGLCPSLPRSTEHSPTHGNVRRPVFMPLLAIAKQHIGDRLRSVARRVEGTPEHALPTAP